MASSHTPYLSFVVTSRNDGNSSDALDRTQIFLDSLISQIERFNLNSELIVVEWNPPLDRRRLSEVIQWPDRLHHCKVRIIEVSPDIHHRFTNSEIIPLFQMIAKNVGIRRARARFILATNIDILFSNELIRFFSSEMLNADRMYRIDRFDIPFNIPQNLNLDARLEWCSKNVLRVYRYLETVELIEGMIPDPKPVQMPVRQRLSDWLFKRGPLLHTNACGDFTLLSSDYWMKVAGNPEFPVRAMKLDSLLCYAAHYAGARENVLVDPMRIYHIEHAARADGAYIALANRSSDNSRIQLSLSQYQKWINWMRAFRRPIIFNKEDWGLAGKELPEIVIG